MTTRLAHSIPEAAAVAGVSPTLIRRAIHKTSAEGFPPPLPAHRKGTHRSAPLLVLDDDLREWLKAFPAA